MRMHGELNRLEWGDTRVDMQADISEKGQHNADVTLQG